MTRLAIRRTAFSPFEVSKRKSTSNSRTLRPWKRRGLANEVPAREIAPVERRQLVDELPGVGRQGSPRVPGDGQPPSDRRSALNQGRGVDAAWKRYVRGDYRDTVAHPGQGDERVGSRALQKHARPDARDAACGVEPLARAERPVEQKQRLVGQLRDVERATAAQRMLPRHHRHTMRGKERLAPETIVRDDQGQVDIAALEAIRQPQTAVFDKMHLDR